MSGHTTENESQIAYIRQQIEAECEALRRVFEEPAIVASHTMIQARYRNLDNYHTALEQHVGAQEALTMLMDMYQHIIG